MSEDELWDLQEGVSREAVAQIVREAQEQTIAHVLSHMQQERAQIQNWSDSINAAVGELRKDIEKKAEF